MSTDARQDTGRRGQTENGSPSALSTIRSSPGFVQMFTGQAISAFGDWMATVAFMTVTNTVTGGNNLAVGGVLVLRLAPGVVAGPLAGRLARRFDYRRTMMTMDALRAVMVALVPFVYSLWWIYLWAFLIEVASLIFIPARDSSIPELLEDEGAIPLANSLILGSSFGTIPLGAGGFALIAALTAGLSFGFIPAQTHPAAFWIDGLTYLASLYFISRIRVLRSARVVEPGHEDEAPRGAFHEAFAIPVVRMVIVPALTIALGLGALFSLGISLVRNVMNASDSQFGILIAVFGMGAACGLGILQLRGARRTIVDFKIAVAAVGAAIFLTVLTPFLYVGLAGALFFGAASAYAMAGGMSTLQEQVEGEARVLGFTAFHVLIRAGLGIGAIAAGLLGQFVGAVTLPALGSLASSQWVLSLSGLVVLATAALIRDREGRATPAR